MWEKISKPNARLGNYQILEITFFENLKHSLKITMFNYFLPLQPIFLTVHISQSPSMYKFSCNFLIKQEVYKKSFFKPTDQNIFSFL